jgi:hypothetical protein
VKKDSEDLWIIVGKNVYDVTESIKKLNITDQDTIEIQ